MDGYTRHDWVPEWLQHLRRQHERGATAGHLLGRMVRYALAKLPREQSQEFLRMVSPGLQFGSQLHAVVRRFETGAIENYGLVGIQKVTSFAVKTIADHFQATQTVSLAAFRYHSIGSGSTAENQSDTQLVYEFTNHLTPSSMRVAGTQTTGGANNIYRTVATITVNTNVAVVEHGVFTSSYMASKELLDRTVFAVINLANGDSIQATYDLTVQAEA